MVIDQRFAAETIAREGDPGRTWLAALPSVVAAACDRWRLVVDGEPMYGYLAVVLPVRHGDVPCALKVGWIDEESVHEPLALSTWNGRGAVRLLDHDPERGALLLERLDPQTTLEAVPLGEAIPVAARLLRRLAVPAPDGLPTLARLAHRWAYELVEEWRQWDRELPQPLVDAAVATCVTLGPTSAALLANADLHYGNILRGTREPWILIDPKPISGDPEFAVAPLLWTRCDGSTGPAEIESRLATIVAVAGLDASRARGWSLARVIDNRLWCLQHGFTEDAAKCARIAAALFSSDSLRQRGLGRSE